MYTMTMQLGDTVSSFACLTSHKMDILTHFSEAGHWKTSGKCLFSSEKPQQEEYTEVKSSLSSLSEMADCIYIVDRFVWNTFRCGV